MAFIDRLSGSPPATLCMELDNPSYCCSIDEHITPSSSRSIRRVFWTHLANCMEWIIKRGMAPRATL
jgi:hypothetical protein